jgi:predicted amidohydrolase YtcJ
VKRFPLNFIGAIVALISLGAHATNAQSAAASDYAITHAKIFTLAGPPIEDGTVVIHEGKISAVGAGVSIPAGAQVIDAKGLQVYPGLFDPVTQMGLSEMPLWTPPKPVPSIRM